MKKGRRNLLILGNKVLSGALALLGFASCSSGGEAPDEYGSPYAKYEIKGKVVDTEQEAVPDARILMRRTMVIGGDAIGFTSSADTVYTGKDGTYLYKTNGGGTDRFRVVCEDPSGVYKADSTDVTPVLTGGHGWYEGGSKEEVNFMLEKKDNKE
ncbi:MAG: radical SAM-associated putative lipoprotein [Bacteroides sp.]|nr:radical SAM-associated putative lipoprotein [Bacteroides sp.]